MSQRRDPGPQHPEEPDSLEDAYCAEYLRECAGGNARAERLEELKRRIAAGAYKVDADWVAEELLRRGELDSD